MIACVSNLHLKLFIMRSLILFFCVVFCSAASFATIRTVSNGTAGGAQFSNIQAAVDASASGDTVYVHGSPTPYTGFTITNKQLVIIGPGWTPDKNLPLTANIAGVTITTTTGNAGSSNNSEFQGLLMTNFAVGSGVNNLRILRNQFNGSFSLNHASAETATGCVFEGNVFYANISACCGATYNNYLFQNNIFYGVPCCTAGNISGFTNCTNVRFDHNLFYTSPGTFQVFSSNCRFIDLSNNIFVNRNAATNLSFSTFTNNITFNCGTNDPWTLNSNVDGGSNIVNQDPQMADQAQVNGGNATPTLNFTIAAGPANNAGSDGKDMGLLYDPVGSLNWANSRNSRLPRIFKMNITTPIVAVGGNISVTVEARKSN